MNPENENLNHSAHIKIDRLPFSTLKEILKNKEEMNSYTEKLLWCINKKASFDANSLYELTIKIKEMHKND